VSQHRAAPRAVEEQPPGHEADETPGGHRGGEFVEFDFELGDAGAASPDFRADAADEGEQQEGGARGHQPFGRLVGARVSPDQAGTIQQQRR